jgi:pimeloyl-ACP methyl ester carboxylesterase
MPFFPRENVRMHYEIFEGLVDRDTIAFHGNLASNAWWQPALEVLRAQPGARKKGRFIAAEWRGCGRSEGLSSEEELHLPALAEDYNGLLRSLGVSGAAVVAHSTGGLIALYAMRRAPELYSRALLLDPVGATGVQFGPEMYAAFTAMSQSRELCEAVMTGTIRKTVQDPVLLRRIVDDAFGVHPLVWHGVAKMLHGVDFRAELPHIPHPVLVLHGENDQILPKADSVALAEGLPHGKFLELPERGHSANVEDPELFVRHLNQFLFG